MVELERVPGLLTAVDGGVLAGYCEAWATIKDCQAIIERDGLTSETANGFLQPRPEVAIRDRAWQRLQRFAAELGFSPASRTRIRTSKPSEPTDEDGLD